MTDPQVDAGRELDAVVAEEVMGLQVVDDDWPCQEPSLINQAREYHASQYRHGPGDPDYVYLPEGERFSGPWPPNPNGYSDVEPVPFYSTDIEAAWEVVERLSLPDKVSFGVLRLFDGGWKAYTYSEDRGLDIEAEADTAPLAICRCALKAVRADTEGADERA